MEIVRLRATDTSEARLTFAMMSAVFDEEPWAELHEDYLLDLLARESVWVYAALEGRKPVGGLTAHLLPMTRAEQVEVLIYDLAVRVDHQRRGLGRALVDRVREDAAALGAGDVWVPADDDDGHALDFYRRIGGAPQAVTVFTFPGPA